MRNECIDNKIYKKLIRYCVVEIVELWKNYTPESRLLNFVLRIGLIKDIRCFNDVIDGKSQQFVIFYYRKVELCLLIKWLIFDKRTRFIDQDNVSNAMFSNYRSTYAI